MRLVLCLLALTSATTTTTGENTISKVVALLQEMLTKSKEDGTHDREVYSAFKCYCDTNDEDKTNAIATATADVARMESFLADRRAMNTKLSQEIGTLTKDIADNEAARASATSVREQETSDFEGEESDLETSIDQMDRAIEVLAAIGADQTASTGADNTQLMAGDATAAAKAHLAAVGLASEVTDANARADESLTGFIKKGGKAITSVNVEHLNEDMKAALRDAAVFLEPKMNKKLQSLLQAPGNYNAQSGELVGVLKNMNDTFAANLENARQEETKKQEEYDEYIGVKETEHTDMTSSNDAKKVELGDNEADIATTQGELDTTQGILDEDNTFLGELKDRCADKAAEYEKRNMLRTNEDAAIAQAISILQGDSAQDTLGATTATSTLQVKGPALFLQKRTNVKHAGHSKSQHAARKQIIADITSKARQLKSLRLAKVASAITAGNPFTDVLAMIKKMITAIDTEETDDVQKKSWCESEQSTNNENMANKATDVQTLESNIGNLDIVASETKANTEQARADLTTNRASAATETESRQSSAAVFKENLANLEEAEKILGKAINVLDKYYKWLHASQAAHSYTEHTLTDSGGANIKQITCTAGNTGGKAQCVDEFKEACSAVAECVGFNTAGWLKSALADESEWYDWEGGDLYVKTFETAAFIQQPATDHSDEPETFGDAGSQGQGDKGNEVINMLTFIQEETVKETHAAIDDEKSAQATYETTMTGLTQQEAELENAITEYGQSLATTEKSIEEAHEDKATTQREHDAIERYLTEIEPHCTFYITKYQERTDARAAEKTELEGAIVLLEGSPAFTAAVAAKERADLGKCLTVCDDEGHDHAKCLACQDGTSVFGYCASNGSAPGCDDATATSSAAALA